MTLTPRDPGLRRMALLLASVAAVSFGGGALVEHYRSARDEARWQGSPGAEKGEDGAGERALPPTKPQDEAAVPTTDPAAEPSRETAAAAADGAKTQPERLPADPSPALAEAERLAPKRPRPPTHRARKSQARTTPPCAKRSNSTGRATFPAGIGPRRA